MAVEIYFIEEAEELITNSEKTDEWYKLAEKLGMKGQIQQVSEEGKSPIPFQKLSVGEHRVYKTLCPYSTDYKEYSRSTIPLRVMSIIALAVQENYFDKIKIWHNLANPDPIVVGIKGSEWNENDTYLIARWGDELRSFAELKKIATKTIVETATNRLTKLLKNIEEDAYTYLSGGYLPNTSHFSTE